MQATDRAVMLDADDLTDDALTATFRVYQRRRGHRYSLDDTVTAWRACLARPGARRVLDLGSGLGSVLLMLAYRMPEARLCAVEAQAESFELLRRNVARNGVSERVASFHGDLRDSQLVGRLLKQHAPEGFDLVTGTPPYVPPGRGPVSPDPQRAHARVELRGGVEDYLATAARVLAPGGRVVLCADGRRPERVARGAADAGLAVLEMLDVVPSARKGVLFGVHCLAVRGDIPAPVATPVRLPDFVARDTSGARTQASRELRHFFGLESDPRELPSPPLRNRSQVATGQSDGGGG